MQHNTASKVARAVLGDNWHGQSGASSAARSQTPDMQMYRQTINPSSSSAPPHPWAHHTRAASRDATLLFLTNVAILPSPASREYSIASVQNLSAYEAGSAQEWRTGKTWNLEWPYYAAVDDDPRSAWRSLDGKEVRFKPSQ